MNSDKLMQVENVANGEPMSATEQRSRFVSDIIVLTKARLITLVLVTTFIGFCMASGDKLHWILLLHTLIGTAFIAAAAGVLNQVLEHRVDKLMKRTRNRPLPAGRMRRSSALLFGVVMATIGFVYLALFVNMLSAWLALATLGIYIFLYTPLKRFTWLCVTVGAVSGAIPPMVGWTAVRPDLTHLDVAGAAGAAGAWILFGVLFLWQMPHFLSLAWVYRDDYAGAGFVMLRKYDTSGFTTALESLLYTLALALVTFLPSILHMVQPIYFFGAVICNAGIFYCAVKFMIERSRPNARRLFLSSIIYLPVILILMVCTKA